MRGFVTIALLITLSAISVSMTISLTQIDEVINTVELAQKANKKAQHISKRISLAKRQKGQSADKKLNLRYLINMRDKKLMSESHSVYQAFLRVYRLSERREDFSILMKNLLEQSEKCFSLDSCLSEKYATDFLDKIKEYFRFDHLKLRPQVAQMHIEHLAAFLSVNTSVAAVIQDNIQSYESGKLKTNLRIELLKAMKNNPKLAKDLAGSLNAGKYMQLYHVKLNEANEMGSLTFRSERGKSTSLVEREVMIFDK